MSTLLKNSSKKQQTQLKWEKRLCKYDINLLEEIKDNCFNIQLVFQPEPMSGPVDDALHTPQVISIKRSRTPIVNTEPETHGEIDIEMLPHPPDPLALPDELKKLPPSREITAHCQIDKSKKFLPVIQLPNGQYISLTGEPVQPSIPSVIIPSTFVDVSSYLKNCDKKLPILLLDWLSNN